MLGRNDGTDRVRNDNPALLLVGGAGRMVAKQTARAARKSARMAKKAARKSRKVQRENAELANSIKQTEIATKKTAEGGAKSVAEEMAEELLFHTATEASDWKSEMDALKTERQNQKIQRKIDKYNAKADRILAEGPTPIMNFCIKARSILKPSSRRY